MRQFTQTSVKAVDYDTRAAQKHKLVVRYSNVTLNTKRERHNTLHTIHYTFTDGKSQECFCIGDRMFSQLSLSASQHTYMHKYLYNFPPNPAFNSNNFTDDRINNSTAKINLSSLHQQMWSQHKSINKCKCKSLLFNSLSHFYLISFPAIPDAISETVGKSRRLIIVLTPEAFTKTSENKVGLLQKMPPEHLSLNNNITSQLNWGPYECWVGLYDALVKECLQVILVQVGGEVDEALLPESLRYVKQTQGILKWKQHYTINPNERFWKQLRYRMPPVPKARRGFMV